MTKKHLLFRKQHGLSLIELLISMVLGSFIMVAASQVIVSSFSSKRLLNAEAELQENARFGITIVGSLLQKAGGFGCSSPENATATSLLNMSLLDFNPEQSIQAWEADGTGRGDTYTTTINPVLKQTTDSHWVSPTGATISLDTPAVANSDIVQVWYKDTTATSITAVPNDTTLLTSDIDLDQNEIIIINDCKSITFAQVCNCDTTDTPACDGTDNRVGLSACSAPGNTAHSFNDLHIPTAEISTLEKALLFVGSVTNGSKDIPTLFISRLGTDAELAAPEEVLSHVESMQILFGQDTTGDYSPNFYVSANSVTDWQNVISAKISLLLRSQSNFVLPEAQNITFNGATVNIAAGDRHLRRVFSSTISLRNRNIGH